MSYVKPRMALAARIGAVVTAAGIGAACFASPAAAAEPWYRDGSHQCAAGQHVWVGMRAAGKVVIEWTPTDWYNPNVRSYQVQDTPFLMNERVDLDIQGGLWRIRASQSTAPSDLTGIYAANSDCA